MFNYISNLPKECHTTFFPFVEVQNWEDQLFALYFFDNVIHSIIMHNLFMSIFQKKLCE